MSTTSYTQFDLINIVRSANPYDTGTRIHVNASNSLSGINHYGPVLPTPPSMASGFNTSITADVTHDTPINPIPAAARITNVEFHCQYTHSGSANMTATWVTTGSQSILTVAVSHHIFWLVPDPADPWITTNQLYDNDYLDSDPVGASPTGAPLPQTRIAGITAGGGIAKAIYDFTLNPNGDFPSGYMTYSQFISKFSSVQVFVFCDDECTASPESGGLSQNMDVNFITTSDFSTANWEMDVTWDVPVTTAWTVSPTTVAPGDPITLTRDPLPELKDDVEIPEELIIDDKHVRPDDPLVDYWLRGEIRIRIPISEATDEPPPPTMSLFITTFSGTVSLGTITITYADLSGIYRIDDTVHHDELYDRATTTLDTIITTILTPFFQTYYINASEDDVSHYCGTRMRVVGQGFLSQFLHSVDNINNDRLVDLLMVSMNNVMPYQHAQLVDQRASLRVVLLDSRSDMFFNISKVILFTKPIFTGYPQ